MFFPLLVWVQIFFISTRLCVVEWVLIMWLVACGGYGLDFVVLGTEVVDTG